MKYDKLLNKYKNIIDELYEYDSSSTPDWMTYDYEGFSDKNYVLGIFKEEEAIEKLSQAVNKASTLLKFYKHNYEYTFA